MSRLGRHLLALVISVAFLTACATAVAEPFLCPNPESYDGKTVNDGQCVAFVREAAKAPKTSEWKEGLKIRGNDIRLGSAIATFRDGKYPNEATGNHAAIYDGQDTDGIFVWDQWKGQPVHRRHIKFRGGEGSPSNDGDAFSVIER